MDHERRGQTVPTEDHGSPSVQINEDPFMVARSEVQIKMDKVNTEGNQLNEATNLDKTIVSKSDSAWTHVSGAELH